MKTTLRLFLLILLLLFVGRYLACSGGDVWEEKYPLHSSRVRAVDERWLGEETRDGVMGTRFSVEVHADGERDGRRGIRAAWNRIHELEARFSTWIPDSLVSRVNREADDRPIAVDEDILRVLDVCREVHAQSGGAFDPTVGPLLKVWKPLATLNRLPDETTIRQARALVGFPRIGVDQTARTVVFETPGMALDFGAVAKGYAAEEATRAALAAGALACRVTAGGDMYGAVPEGAAIPGFDVLVRDPDGGSSDTLADVSFRIRNAGVATSGNYGRFTEIAGKRYSHILDPRTGRPVEDAILQVTVIAPSGALADAYATALTVLGVDAGLALADRLENVVALFLLREGDDIVRRASRGFPGVSQ